MSITYIVSQEYLDFYYRKYLGRAKGAKAILSLFTEYKECLKLVAQGEMAEDPSHLIATNWDFSSAVVRFFPVMIWPEDYYDKEDWLDSMRDDRGCSGGICSCCGRTRD
jgi:hypothetical protein